MVSKSKGIISGLPEESAEKRGSLGPYPQRYQHLNVENVEQEKKIRNVWLCQEIKK